MPQSDEILSARDLAVGYGFHPLFPPLSFAVKPGELWLVVGRNGSGKSTMLRTLVGLIPPVRGEITRPPGNRVAFVPQRQFRDPAIPTRARDLVEEGLEAGWSFLYPFGLAAAKRAVGLALAQVDARDLADQSFVALSEGQRQRVLLARALVGRPDLVILDEPTAAMDLVSEREALQLLDQSRRESRVAVLLVSHHVPSALEVADRLIAVDADEHLAVVGTRAEIAKHPLVQRLVAWDRGPIIGVAAPSRQEGRFGD